MRAFPLDLLPEALQRAIAAKVAMSDMPVGAVGTAALAVVSHAAQGIANVDCLHTAGVTYPVSGFFMVLARSGDAKSSLFNAFMPGVYRWQERQRRVFDEEMIEHTAARKIWDTKRTKAEKAGEAAELLDLERSAPKRPLNPDNIVSKTTTNGIFQTLEKGWPTLGIFTGEGGSLLGGHSWQAQNSPTEMASLLTTVWDGSTVDRTTGEVTMRLSGRRISALIMVQAEVAEKFLTNPTMMAHGILARFLIVNPPAWNPPEADFTNPDARGRHTRLDRAMDEFHERIERMLDAEMRTSPFDQRVLELSTINWKREAASHMQDWFNGTCRQWRSEGNPFFNRAFEHACRLAGAMSLFEGEAYISEYVARAATALIEFYADQWRSLDLGVGETRNSDERPIIEKMVQWFRRQKEPVGNREFSRESPNCFRQLNGSKREAILKSMERDEYISAVEVTMGKTRKVMWALKKE